MKIKNLAGVPFENVLSCFLSAFEGYFIKLPEDPNYWWERFTIARVNWELSFGMFDEDELVGYIINCVDQHRESLTAYNTGTGVLPNYRGRAIVDQLYEHAIPVLKAHGVEKCLLEVICENKRALKVYNRIGFKITRQLRSFTGSLPETSSGITLQKCHFSQVIQSGLYEEALYSWDNTAKAVELMQNRVQTWCLGDPDSPEAYLVIDNAGNIIQLFSKSDKYPELLTAAGPLAKEVMLKNVSAGRESLINTLQKWHLSNPVNQYEMEMEISSF